MKEVFTSHETTIQHNQRGSVLLTAFITMVILSMSIAAIMQLTINSYTATEIKTEILNDQSLGESLIKQSIYEFEQYMFTNKDFNLLDLVEVPFLETKYGITITDVTGTPGFTQFGVGSGEESRVYEFSYLLTTGRTLIMYSYISTAATLVPGITQYDFSIASNEYVVLNGGYIEDSFLFGRDIHFGYIAPFYNRVTLVPDTTPSLSGAYPSFRNPDWTSDVYYTNQYTYCTSNCYALGPTVNDEFILQESEFVDIETSGLEKGTLYGGYGTTDFFSSFNIGNEIIDFVSNVGPTGSLTITDPMTLANIGTVVLANSAAAPTTEPYTDVTADVLFDPANTVTTLNYAAVHNGNLTINRNFTITNNSTEILVVNGDLTFDNPADINFQGFIVVLGDLTFTGNSVVVDGGFYVTGQTIVEFNELRGFQDGGGGADYGFTLISIDNVLINSLWETHTTSNRPSIWNWFIYTDESIYIDAVNSRIYVNGVFFAAARGNSGNYIPMVNESAVPIMGIVIDSYRGYINTSGNAVPSSQENRNRFYFNSMTFAEISSTFFEIPTFGTLELAPEGPFFERSEFIIQ